MLTLDLVIVLLLSVCLPALSFCHGYGRSLYRAGETIVQDDPTPTPAGVPEQWFKQKLDHFNPADTRYWQQRYYINDTFYRPGGPAFLFIGPETALPEIYARTGAWLEYAEVYHAIGFAVEHRYYGKSHPTSDLSTANLQYLTVEQALEDLATFITDANKAHNLTDAKWITFGGSYSGMLSAWMRYKFPHLISGAVADSAPVVVPITAPEYPVGMGDGLRTVPGCYDVVKSAFDDIRSKLQSDTGTQRLRELFRMCDFDRRNDLDVQNVMYMLLTPLLSTIQYSDTHAEYMSGGVYQPSISSMCSVLTDVTRGQPLERLADFAMIVAFNYTVLNGSCMEASFGSIQAKGKKLKFEDNLDAFTDRQWRYQTCTQIGVFVTTESDNQPFGDILSDNYYYKICEGLFGAAFNKSLLTRGHQDIIMNYGGLGIRATNVVYTQGSYDPWYKYGITKDPNPRSKAIFINGVGHVPDIFSSSPLDNAELKQARAWIQRYIGQWISTRNIGLIG